MSDPILDLDINNFKSLDKAFRDCNEDEILAVLQIHFDESTGVWEKFSRSVDRIEFKKETKNDPLYMCSKCNIEVNPKSENIAFCGGFYCTPCQFKISILGE